MPMTQNFPKNTEMEVELTFVSQPATGAPGGGGGQRGGGFFAGVNEVAATGESASIRIHHSLVELPDNKYKPRVYDPRSGFGEMAYEDFAAPLGRADRRSGNGLAPPDRTLFVAGLAVKRFYTPERIRTSDPRIRSPILYPAELRALIKPIKYGISEKDGATL